MGKTFDSYIAVKRQFGGGATVGTTCPASAVTWGQIQKYNEELRRVNFDRKVADHNIAVEHGVVHFWFKTDSDRTKEFITERTLEFKRALKHILETPMICPISGRL